MTLKPDPPPCMNPSRNAPGHDAASDIWCVIPVYNSAEPAVKIARACRAYVDRVLVVDDGSTDADLSRRLADDDIHVERHAANQGKGRALMTALRFVADRGGTHMITLDGDGQHRPEDIPAVLAAVRASPHAIVIGCRDFDTPNVPDSSRFGRRFSNFWIRLETGHSLSDTQSGFRAYPVDPVSRLRLRGRRYDFEVEILVRAIWAGIEIREIPVSVIYPPVGERISHFQPFIDNVRLSLMHTQLVGRRLAPWPHRRLTPWRDAATPASLWRHPRQTMQRLLRENSSPSGLAAAAAVGSLLAVLPLIWCHMAVILYASARLHLNKVMALGIQNLYMPPFTPFICIQVGFYLRHGEWWTEFTRETLLYNIHHRLFEWLIGSLLLAPVYAAIAAAVTYFTARAIQRRMHRGEAD